MKYDVKVQFLSIFLISLLIFQVKADIPVHCLKSQIVGSWTLYTTEAQEKNVPELYQHTCGHKLPSHESTALNFNMDKKLFVNKYVIDLHQSDQAIMKTFNGNENKKEGKWTMVYDEGFDIIFESTDQLNSQNFFVFSKYSLNNKNNESIKSKWASHCYSTLIGWFHIGRKWGCFYAKRNDVPNPEIATNGEAENKLNVLENQITSREDDNNNSSENQTFSTVNIFFEKQEKIKSIVEPDILDNVQNESNFLESRAHTRNKITLHAQFKDHMKFVEKLNSMNGMWKAENYENFASMTVEELNSFAGRKRNKNSKMSLFSAKDIFFNNNFVDTYDEESELNNQSKFLESSLKKLKNSNRMKSNRSLSNKDSDEIELPEEYLEYKKYMSTPRSQGNCGSCFAASTLTMLEARIRKHYPDLIQKYFSSPEDFALSLKHVIECSVYNQGCDGGYSYLVSKFFKEFEVVLKNCYQKDCKKNCKDARLNDIAFTISDFGYVGGSYGKCNEKQIMKEVYQNGPIVLSLEPDYSFMFYKNGVYQSPISSWITNKTKRPEWEKVDHSMVLVGWGVENIKGKNVKYWLLQNSWGSGWGDNGFMKFIRGIDHLGIESICEYGMPVLKN